MVTEKTMAKANRVVQLLLIAALAACSGGGVGSGSTASSSVSSSSTPTSTASASTATSTATATATMSESVSATPSAGSVRCRRLSSATAATVLGSPVTETVPADLTNPGEQGDGPALKKLDGCLYQSPKGSLGYDVMSLAGMSSAAQLDLVRHQVPDTPGTHVFDPSATAPSLGTHSYGFTSAQGVLVFAVVQVVRADVLTTVSLTVRGGTAVAAQRQAIAAAVAVG